MASADVAAERPIPKDALTHLDLLRGAAAALVLVGHVRGLFFVDWESVVQRTAWLKLVYLVSGLGHECVIVFFVLSGFFIGHSVLAAHRADRWHWRKYAVRRLSRLYVVLLPGLLVTAALDVAGMQLFGAQGIYAGDIGAARLQLADARTTLGIDTLLANLFFLQGIHAKEYGTNGPLWSLSFEGWFYVIFPMAVRALAGSARLGFRIMMGVGVVALLALGGKAGAMYFVIWALGALMALLWQLTAKSANASPAKKGAKTSWMLAVALLGFAFTVVIARIRLLPTKELNELVLGLGTAVLVWTLLVFSEMRASASSFGRRVYTRFAETSARFSFTLYIMHFPLVVFLFAALGMTKRWEPTPLHLSFGVLICVGIALLYAYPISKLTEANTDRARRWIERRVPFFAGQRAEVTAAMVRDPRAS